MLAGGNLLALGRTSGHTNWLQPVFGASQATANGAISAPDATHPVLTTPNRVDYQRYVDQGQAWVIENDKPFGANEEEIMRYWCARAGIAYLGRADIGHDVENKVVPFGALRR